MKVGLIGAMDDACGCGKDGSIPWRSESDLRLFRAMTMGCVVVVGRVTAEGLPELPGRHVLTLSHTLPDGPGVVRSASDAIERAGELGVEGVWFAGGEQVWLAGLPYASRAVITRIRGAWGCDARLPWDEIRGHLLPGHADALADGMGLWGDYEVNYSHGGITT